MTLPPSRSALHRDAPHESGLRHTTGEARYVDDLVEPPGLLHGVIVTSPVARGRLLAVHAPAGAVVLTAADVPGENRIGPIVHDEPVLADGEVLWHGQPVAIAFAATREEARVVADAVRVEVRAEPPVLTIEDAEAQGRWLLEPHVIARGDVDAALAAAHLRVEGVVRTPGQDHFYLETHCALSVPGEGRTMHVWSSTQHPTEIQRMVAHVLDVPDAAVVVEVTRLGGGFGGKESQATTFAALAALGARRTGQPCKVWLDRGEDMRITGKRHPFRGTYRAGFDADGKLLALDVEVVADGGATIDLTGPIVDRSLFHLDNAYFVPALRFVGKAVRTDLPSNTAFRGFGGPQGMVVVEDAMERAAARLGLDPVELRRRNFYGPAPRDRTPYGMEVPDCRIGRMTDRLVARADLPAWRAEVAAFNARSKHVKRGIGFVPVKFGISFTNSLLNQAGALVLVYADGSVQLNHGGTEMGQGLHTKMLAVCADVLGVDVGTVRVMDTSTAKVPNTSATAASAGSDLNGQAVREACEIVRERMRPVAEDLLGASDVRFEAGACSGGGRSIPFGQVAKECWIRRISLSSTGFYRTPGIAYDRAKGAGTPFYYFAYGVCLAEVEVNGLTGEHRVRRVEILHDVGDSLVPTIDLGQIEGAFVQGMGWLTTESVLYGPDGRCLTKGPSTYKVPAVGDVPEVFRVELLADAAQPGTIGGSKAVGEPPFMLAIAVPHALRDAVRAFGPGEVHLALPASAEAILMAVERSKGSVTCSSGPKSPSSP
jgi:xanthine dehydrogenase molybdopterin binding subunit